MKISDDWALPWIVNRKSFNDSRFILEIGGGDFERAFILAKNFPEKIVFSVDFRYSKQAQNNVIQSANLSNLNIIKIDGVIDVFAENLFDFCYSVAVGEHISKLHEFLSSISKTLKNGATYNFIQGPFWTSYKGHHHKHWIPEVVDILGGYRHLLYSKEQMRDYLLCIKNLPSQFSIEEALSGIYDRDDLSRLSPSETLNIINSGNFFVEKWQLVDDKLFDKTSACAVRDLISTPYGIDDLLYSAVYVELSNRKA